MTVPASVGAVTAIGWNSTRRRIPGADFTRIYPFIGGQPASPPHDHRRRRADPVTEVREPRIRRCRATSGRRRSVGDRRLATAGAPQLRRRKGGSKGLNVLGTLARAPPADAARTTRSTDTSSTRCRSTRVSASCSSCGSRRGARRSTSGNSTCCSREEAGITDDESRGSPTARTRPGGRPRRGACSVPSTSWWTTPMITDATWAVLAEAMDGTS